MGPGALLDLLASRADDGLDLVRVDETGDVGVADLGGGEDVVLLVDRLLVKSAKDIIEEGKGTLSPDNESAEVSTRGELEQVQSPDVDELDTGEVAEGLDDTVILVIDNEGTTALTVAAVPQLALSSTELARVGDLDDIGVSLESLEESDGLLGLGESLDFGGDDEGDFLDLLDAVATGEDERWEGRSGKGRNNSESALVLVDLDVPLAPGLGRREHATATAHVTKGSLARAVGSSSSNTGNTGNGTTSTPGLGTRLVACILSDGISLAVVLGDALVDLLDDIKPDGGGQNRREGEGGRGLPSDGANVDGGS